ncbi:MAG: transcriptional regulator GlxA family with amidase domain [Paracoccaceae bacterium]
MADTTKHMQIMPKPSIQIALMNPPGAQQSAILGLADIFRLLPRLSPDGGQSCRVDLHILDEAALDDRPLDAFLFPPSIEGAPDTPHSPFVPWARARHQQGALTCSVCAGAFWLGHAGLLDHRPATTHWALEPQFRAMFPKVDLRPEHILVDDHDIITAGGLMAWLDLGLFLTGYWFGPDMVSRLARHLLVDPAGREQRHYSSFRPNRAHGDAQVLRSQRHIELRFAGPMASDELATIAGLSPRTFLRRFKAATGYTPATYLQNLRIEKARGALERSADPTAKIAWDVGYQDASAFGRVFKSVTGLTPGAYRNRFRVSPARAR